MTRSRTMRRLPLLNTCSMFRVLVCVALIAETLIPIAVYAQGNGTILKLQPHCDFRDQDGFEYDGTFGPLPDNDYQFNLGKGKTNLCRNFEIESPEMLKTKELAVGDILDIDLVLENPSERVISRVRAWLTYDPEILEGITVWLNQTTFSSITPGESDFAPSEGLLKMEVSGGDRGRTDGDELFIARFQFKILKESPDGTILSFHDIKPDGHTVVTTESNGEESSVLDQDPGPLHVIIKITPEDTDSSDTGDTDEQDEVADSGNDNGGLRKNGESCNIDEQCESGLCGSGICIPSLRKQGGSDRQTKQPKRTAFSLLQVRGVRATTEGSSIFLAWDALKSSELKAYNVYYGTISGKYIQRRTIGKIETTLTIRALPVDVTYYLAVRAVSHRDEESAFSQEVAVTVGDVDSSTAPLDPGSIAPARNPLAGTLIPNDGEEFVEETIVMPGKTGIPSTLALVLIGSSVVGTAFALRRQSVTAHPHALEPRA